MLSSKKRVQKTIFTKISFGGKVIQSPYFSIKFVKNTDFSLKESRFSVVISKKIVSKAVSRNLIKRRVYSCIKEMIYDIKPSFIVIFYIKKEILGISFANLKKEIKKTFEKIGLLE